MYVHWLLNRRQNHLCTLSDGANKQLEVVLTLRVVVGLCEHDWCLQLYLVSEDVTRRCCPICQQGIISRHPLGADISIDLDRMSGAVCRFRRDSQVGKRSRLFDEIRGLLIYIQYK